MIELIFATIILSLIALIAFREVQHARHIERLENKTLSTDTAVHPQGANGKRATTPNEMAREEGEETPIADIPMMEFTDREFKIQVDGDSETPSEAVARGQR